MSALAACVNKRKEPDVLGISVEIISPKFLATILMLRDLLAGVQPLNLVLQKSGESLVLADIPVCLDKTISFLENLKSANKTRFFTKPNFNKLFHFSKEEMPSLPPSFRTRLNQQLLEWEQFGTNVYMPFLDAFIKEVETALSELDFWMIFNILDPRALSEELDLLDEYRVDELEKLLSHYGDDKFDIYNGYESRQKAGLNPVVVQA